MCSRSDRPDLLSSLSTVEVHNLVAIFTANTDRPPIFVYADQLPGTSPAGGVCLTLDDLPTFDLTPCDGLVIGFQAIDIIRPDLPTRGPRFRPIETLLQQRVGQVGLNQTAYALAVALLGFLDDTMPDSGDWRRLRALPRIIALVVPQLASQRDVRGLVAIRLGPELWDFVQDYQAQWIYLSSNGDRDEDSLTLAEFESLDPIAPDEWLIALEEIQLFRPEVDSRMLHCIDLRPILREAGHAEGLRATLADLARVCRRRALKQPGFRLAAWSLMAEYWLMDEEVDDLVCFVPIRSFDDFTYTGAGTRYYRTLSGDDLSDHGSYRMMSLDALFTSNANPRGGISVAAALPLLRPHLRLCGVDDCLDLGHILWRAGRTTALAHTLTLLACDLSTWSSFDWRERSMEAEAAFEAAWRGCVLLGLENPRPDTMGFRDQQLRAAYGTLVTALRDLAGQVESPRRDFYLGLGAWFNCASPDATGDQIKARLRQVTRYMSVVSQSDGGEGLSSAWVRQLLEIAKASVSLLSTGGQPEFIQHQLDQLSMPPESHVDYARAAADSESPPILLSDFFVQAFQTLVELAEEIRDIYQRTLHDDDKVRLLNEVVLRLDGVERRLFALPHELAVLRALRAQTTRQALKLSRELKGSALLELRLSTASIQQHAVSRVTLIVRNLGRAPAEEVRVRLEDSERFSIHSVTATEEIDALLPAAVCQIGFELKPRVDDQLPLRFTIEYTDRQGSTSKTQDFTVQVVGLDQGPFTRKRNPYIFGNPIQDPRHFFGRRAEVLSVVDHLVARGAQNILLRGARRTGKTSVLFMLKTIVEGASGAREHFDLSPDWDAPLDALRIVFLDLSEMPGIGKPLSASDFYAAVSAAIARAVGLNLDAADRPAEMNRSLFQQDLEQCLDALGSDGRLVLLLDEFDVVETITEPEFYFHLRHVITYLQRITWIVASAAGLYRAVQDYASPLFNVFRIVELTRLGPDDARHLILDPLAGERVQFLDEAVEAILDQTGCHPYFLQLLCSEIIVHLNEKRTNYVLRSTVQTVVEQIVGRGRVAYDHFAYLWDHALPLARLIMAYLLASPEPLDQDTLSKQVCAHVREARPSVDEAWLKGEVSHHLRWLQNVVEAIVLDDQRRYTLGTPLFRYWLIERARRENLLADALAQMLETLAYGFRIRG